MKNEKKKRPPTYLGEERVHPFGEGLLLNAEPLLLQHLDAALLEFQHVLSLRHYWFFFVFYRFVSFRSGARRRRRRRRSAAAAAAAAAANCGGGRWAAVCRQRPTGVPAASAAPFRSASYLGTTRSDQSDVANGIYQSHYPMAAFVSFFYFFFLLLLLLRYPTPAPTHTPTHGEVMVGKES